MAQGIGSAFHETVEEGTYRLHRPLPVLLATGTVGGIDVSIGVVATLLVLDRTGNEVLSALAFGIGFIALTLGRSELFTENFLVPIAAVVAHKASVRSILRLWSGAAATNLLGGLLVVWILLLAAPELGSVAAHKGTVYLERGLGWQALASSVLAGIVITLMTWMQHSSPATGGQLVAAVVTAFLLSFGELSHVIVASVEVFAGIAAGADYGVADWARLVWLWAVGNAVGGIGLVTMLRLVQIGRRRIEHERERPIDETDAAMADVPEGEKREGASGEVVSR